MDASLLSARGIREVIVRLSEASVSEVAADGASANAQRQALGAVTAQQDRFVAGADARVLARTQIAVNAVALEVDAAQLAALAADPAVESISPVVDYTTDLEETVPWIGAAALHGAPHNLSGDGVTVAVLDSGIDYTHVAFGDLATVHDYDAAYGADTGDEANKAEPDWDLIAAHTNVVGGFDYVGEVWPFGRVAPDPDPIDCGEKDVNPNIPNVPLCVGGHGTHVADIIGGELGVAPGVELHAVKVCSAVSTSCSGVALLLGMDYALDPNADGVTDDAVDIINMSLGSDYGQAFDDDLSQAVENASAVGVLTVAAAGNGSDKPYVSGSPAAAPSAISVAQTAVPSSTLPLLEVESPPAIAGSYPAVFQPWSQPLEDHGAITSASLQYGDGAGGNLNGCTALPAASATGKVVLVDRGTCDFSLKIANVAAGGAEAGIIAQNQTGAPFEGGLGACPGDLCTTIPGFMISQANGNLLKGQLPTPGVLVTLDPDSGLDLEGTMVGSSSRGPTMLTNTIKPEIGAPGASISAEAGTADETTPFGGTSGATPMIAGSAALLLEELDRSPAEIKSLLMNYAETEIHNGAPDAPISAPLAAIQRIGAGEVRVDDSFTGSDLAAWDSENETGALSFGFVDAAQDVQLTREVTVANYSATPQILNITTDFRFANDAGGAVSVSHPATVPVPAAAAAVPGSATFDVTLSINAGALRNWTANSGFNGADATHLTLLEYDGYIELDNASVEPLHLAWHVLPRQSGETTVADDSVEITGETLGFPSGETALNNAGENLSVVEGYSLVGESSQLPTGGAGANLPTVDLRYAGVQTIQVPGGSACFAEDSFLLLLAVNTWERQTHANAPAAFEWDIDTDGDGGADYFVFNLDLATNLTDGRNITFVQKAGESTITPTFFADHGTNSANTTLTICAEDIGLTGEDLGTPLTADLLAVDIYFTGRVTDQILGIEFAPLGERFLPIIAGGIGAGIVPPGGSAELTALDFGPDGTNPSETGMLLFTDGTFSAGGAFPKSGAAQDNEAIVVRVTEDLPFDDIADSPFIDDIVWAFDNGITGGCSSDPPLYCPLSNVTREQMATFLDRALDLPTTSTDFFDDDENSIHESAINRLAAAGITGGCAEDSFCPKSNVLRQQMASFLVRGYDLDSTTTDYFTDDEGNIHESDINALKESGITGGCGPTTFCPRSPVTRGQMAAFLHRAEGD